ncbi:MAG: helix-turn-helix domain-containing protein [Pararhodobacter sp.]|nr:helix-turn-helix domain-containing protein [Pararhodobacter sp.]
MEKEIAQFAALAHSQRLAVFRLLMRHHPRHTAAGAIGAALGIRPSTLSAYLSALADAGLIEQSRRGTSLRYRVRMQAIQALSEFLVLDCCRARVDIPARWPGPGHGDVYNVLFLCSGNAARSLMAEALLRQLAGDRFEVFSAGTDPHSEPDPRAMTFLDERGHDTEALWSKDESLFREPDAPRMDFVISLCDRAADAEAMRWPGAPLHSHWPVDDPVPLPVPDAFAAAYAILERRIAGFAALPVGNMARAALQSALDALSDLGAEAS